MLNEQLQREAQQHMSMVNKVLMSRGGQVVMKYGDLADVTAGTEPHDRLHNLDSTDDHNGVDGAVEDNICTFNSSGLPQDSGIPITDIGVGDLEPVEIDDHVGAEIGKYYVTNNITRINVVLPDEAPFGAKIGIIGKGAGGWAVGCNNGQYINMGPVFTMEGGGLESIHFTDGVVLMCITENRNWSVIWSTGNLNLEVA